MASDNKTNAELDAFAFDIFKQTCAVRAVKGNGEQVVIDSYRKAETFMSVRDKIRSGALDVAEPVGPQLADCCAPNLPRNHPHNLVAKLYTNRNGTSIPGDLKKVGRIYEWLKANPTPETDQEQIVTRLAAQFSELGWDLPTINTARAIFPAYVSN